MILIKIDGIFAAKSFYSFIKHLILKTEILECNYFELMNCILILQDLEGWKTITDETKMYVVIRFISS